MKQKVIIHKNVKFEELVFSLGTVNANYGLFILKTGLQIM